VRKTSWLALLMALAFGFGLVQLFRWRFEAGDVYPQYSSLRTDPLGAKALFESLNGVPGVSAVRHFKPVDKMNASDATVFYLGLDAQTFLSAKPADFEKLIRGGGRLIVGLMPIFELPRGKKPGAPAKLETWGVTLALAPPDPKAHSNLLYFDELKDWTVVRTAAGRAILIERTFGQGSIVLAADPYPLSNQALMFDRDTALVSWFAGPSRRMIFDEYHLGVTETGSIAALGRRYRLETFLMTVVLLAVLFIWKNSTPLVPSPRVQPPPASAGQSWGMPYYLLRRAVPSAELIGICLGEWRKSLPLGPRYSDSKLRRVEEIARTERDPVKAYQAIGRALAGEP
jgi:hypothetical protein